MTTTVITGATAGYSYNLRNTWGEVLTAAGNGGGPDSAQVGTKVSTNYYGYQGFQAFDTSSIPDADDVASITLSMCVESGNGVKFSDIVVKEYNWGPTRDNADWRTQAQFNALPTVATLPASSPTTDETYYSFTSTDAIKTLTGLKTGTVWLAMCSQNFVDGVTPTSATGDTSTWHGPLDAGKEPKLTIVHGAYAVTGSVVIDSTSNISGVGQTSRQGTGVITSEYQNPLRLYEFQHLLS